MTDRPRKLIIHAGIHKTGSTAIQHWLSKSALPDAHYFKWRNANHSDLFVLLFEENPQDHVAFSQAGYTRDQAMKQRETEKTRIREQIETSKKEVFVFSAERISSAPAEAVEAMSDFFSELFPDIQIYAYVRKPSGFMTSMFQQHLKTGQIKLDFGALWPGYRRRLDRFYRIFGDSNVHLRSYDQLLENRSDIVSDFARWTGLAANPPGNIVLNWSMSATGMALLYFYRKIVEPDLSVSQRTRFERHVLYEAQTIPGEPFHIEVDCEERQRVQVDKDLAWISRRIGSNFDDRGASGEGVRVFRNEADILQYAVAKSHDLMSWKDLTVLDPDTPVSVETTKDRFTAFLSLPARLRVGIRRGVNWATGRDPRRMS